MTANHYYKCKYCGTIIRIRFQVGFSNMQVNLYCPHCGCHFSGHILVDNDEPSYKILIDGLVPYEGESNNGYVVELSQEFLTEKFKENTSIIPTNGSPFLRFSMLSDLSADKMKKISDLINFSNDVPMIVSSIENNINLLKMKENDLLLQQFRTNEDNLYIQKTINEVDVTKLNSEADCLMLFKHFSFLSLSLLISDNLNLSINKCMSEIYNLVLSKKKETKYYFNFLEKNGMFDYFYDKIPKFICNYLSKIKQFIPIYINREYFDKIDFSIYGVTTIDINDMATLYSNAYELIGDSMDVLVGLDNIDERSSYDNFGSGREKFNEKIANSYKSKFNKIKHFTIDINSKYFTFLKDKLDNVIRNPIAHFNWKVDGVTQLCTFKDNKGKEKNIYIVELANNVISIFECLLIIWEYYYQIIKNKKFIFDHIPFNYFNAQNHIK